MSQFGSVGVFTSNDPVRPPATNYNIGGALPFQPAGNPALGFPQIAQGLGMPAGVQQGLGTLAQQYGQSYQSALAQNQALYNNILGGYQQLLGNQVANQQPIMQGYANLKGEVLGDIAGVGASQKQAIQDVYAQQAGGLQQSLVNAGLGNTTVTGAMGRGVRLDEQKAQIALANQMAQLQAGYASNLGLAGLNYQNQANMQNSALGQAQLNWMNTVQAQYPNAAEYNQLFGQAGQFGQMNADRALQQQLMNRRPGPAFGGGGGGGGDGRVTLGPHGAMGQGLLPPGMGGQNFGGYNFGGGPGGGGGGGGGRPGGAQRLTMGGGGGGQIGNAYSAYGGVGGAYSGAYGGYPGDWSDLQTIDQANAGMLGGLVGAGGGYNPLAYQGWTGGGGYVGASYGGGYGGGGYY